MMNLCINGISFQQALAIVLGLMPLLLLDTSMYLMCQLQFLCGDLHSSDLLKWRCLGQKALKDPSCFFEGTTPVPHAVQIPCQKFQPMSVEN